MKKIYIVYFILTSFLLFSLELPKPKNDQLFAEYDSYRYSKFLKKPITGSGYLAMDGKDRFVFIQLKPLIVEIRKNGGRITYKKGSNMPIDISNMAMDMFFLFETDENISINYNVIKTAGSEMDSYEIIPKAEQNLLKIKVTAKEDKVEKIEILFKDDSKIVYFFRNVFTGRKPDEKNF
jgi:hypothetical protein